jgi:hypothetical protein
MMAMMAMTIINSMRVNPRRTELSGMEDGGRKRDAMAWNSAIYSLDCQWVSESTFSGRTLVELLTRNVIGLRVANMNCHLSERPLSVDPGIED